MTRHPERLVLLGHPVAQSLSPTLQGAALKLAGINCRYVAMDVPPEGLGAVVAMLRTPSVAGNVTVPHKEVFAGLCDVRSAVADRVGAVNTFWTDQEGRLVGDNTDVGGFDHAARQLVEAGTDGLCVGVLGAGGAAAAVCEAVRSWSGGRVVLYARTARRAEALAVRFPEVVTVVTEARGLLRGTHLVVNATPLGLEEATTVPLDPALIPYNIAVMDLAYRRDRTPWIQACRARGLRAEDGLPMLVEQGALAFERWFGVPAPREAMWRSVQR